jgi:hypothetical protein
MFIYFDIEFFKYFFRVLHELHAFQKHPVYRTVDLPHLHSPRINPEKRCKQKKWLEKNYWKNFKQKLFSLSN